MADDYTPEQQRMILAHGGLPGLPPTRRPYPILLFTYDELAREEQPVWLPSGAAADYEVAGSDVTKRRDAVRGALYAALSLFSERKLPVEPLMEVVWGLDDLNLGRQAPIFSPVSYGSGGGQAMQIGVGMGLAMTAAALQMRYDFLDRSPRRSRLESQKQVLRHLLTREPKLQLDRLFGLREDRSEKDAVDRCCANLEKLRATLRKGSFARTGDAANWPQSSFTVSVREAGNRGSEIKLFYQRHIDRAADILRCSSHIT